MSVKPPRATPWQRHGDFERRVRWVPGYNCMEKCEHAVKGNHSKHGDELYLQVRLPDVVSSLCLFTRVRDGKADDLAMRFGFVTTAGITYHFGFAPIGLRARRSMKCDLNAMGRCHFYPDRMLTSVAESEDHWNHGGWVWSEVDQAAVNAESFLVHPEVEHLVLAMTSGIWGRLQDDLVKWRRMALEGS